MEINRRKKRRRRNRGPGPPAVPAAGYGRPAAAANRTDRREDSETNIFSKSLVIEGHVRSDTDIVIRGSVLGNVTCRSNIELNGQVTGNVEAKSVVIGQGGSVEGDIAATDNLAIDHSSVKGNISAGHARVNGPVEGDVAVKGTLTLQREANVRGNITAAGLSVEEGAVMSGQITITRETAGTSYRKPAPVKPAAEKPSGQLFATGSGTESETEPKSAPPVTEKQG